MNCDITSYRNHNLSIGTKCRRVEWSWSAAVGEKIWQTLVRGTLSELFESVGVTRITPFRISAFLQTYKFGSGSRLYYFTSDINFELIMLINIVATLLGMIFLPDNSFASLATTKTILITWVVCRHERRWTCICPYSEGLISRPFVCKTFVRCRSSFVPCRKLRYLKREMQWNLLFANLDRIAPGKKRPRFSFLIFGNKHIARTIAESIIECQYYITIVKGDQPLL